MKSLVVLIGREIPSDSMFATIRVVPLSLTQISVNSSMIHRSHPGWVLICTDTLNRRHIRNVHKLRHQEHCPRCKRGFDTKEAVDTHLLAPSHEICEVLPSPPDDFENGINEATEDWLIGRRANTKIDNWKSLWNLLFPNDEVVLSYGMWPIGSRCPFTR